MYQSPITQLANIRLCVLPLHTLIADSCSGFHHQFNPSNSRHRFMVLIPYSISDLTWRPYKKLITTGERTLQPSVDLKTTRGHNINSQNKGRDNPFYGATKPWAYHIKYANNHNIYIKPYKPPSKPSRPEIPAQLGQKKQEENKSWKPRRWRHAKPGKKDG